MQTALEQPVLAVLADPPGAYPTLGARIEAPITRAVVSAYQFATLEDGTWSVTLDAPLVVGDYLLVWRTPDAEPPDYELFIPLTVSATAGDAPLEPADWTPTAVDVARLTVEYTRGRIDGDTPSSGGASGVFDDDTDPTLAQVEDYIAAAVAEVAGRVGTAVPARCGGLATMAAAWHAAASIEAYKAPAATDDADASYRWKQTSYIATLTALIEQARTGPLRLT